MPYSEHDKEPHQSTNHCPEKQLEIRVNQCGDERLKVHSSYTLKASLKEGVAWFEAPLSSYRSTKSPYSLVALFLLYLKLSFLARLPFFFLQDSPPFFLGCFFFLISCSPSYQNAPPNGFRIFPITCHFFTTPLAHY